MSDTGSSEMPPITPDIPKSPLAEVSKKYEDQDKKPQAALLKKLEEKAHSQGRLASNITASLLMINYWPTHLSKVAEQAGTVMQAVQNPSWEHTVLALSQATAMSLEVGLVTVGAATIGAFVGKWYEDATLKENRK